jgi:uncharacterized coiled-coil protein SlyX
MTQEEMEQKLLRQEETLERMQVALVKLASVVERITDQQDKTLELMRDLLTESPTNTPTVQ